jgi:hypothetical protein
MRHEQKLGELAEGVNRLYGIIDQLPDAIRQKIGFKAK